MKQIILITLAIWATASAVAQNPISPIGLYIADPTARVMKDGKLYIYGSADESTSYYCSHRHHVMSSKDGKTWDLTRDIFSSKGDKDNVPYSDNYLYAPDCIEKNGTYYLYYCLSGSGDVEGVATAKSPTGPFSQGKSLPGLNQIDPAVFIDDDGQAYYYWGQFVAKGAKLKPNMIDIEMSTVVDSIVTEEQHLFHEGVWMSKRNGTYYLVYTGLSERGQATAISYSTSKSPLGPFTYQGIILDNFGCDPNSWNNHGSIAEFNGKWYVFYHRSTHASRMMRKACAEKISFNDDGTIPRVEMTSQGMGEPLDAFSVIDAERACLLQGKLRIQQCAADNEELTRIEDSNIATYKYLNFSKAPTKMIIIATPHAGGRVTVYSKNMGRAMHGSVEIEAGDGKTPKQYTVELKNLQAGVHPISLRFSGAKDTDLFTIDKFLFE